MRSLLPVGQSVSSRITKLCRAVRDKAGQYTLRLSHFSHPTHLINLCLPWQRQASRTALFHNAVAHCLRLPASESRQRLSANRRFLAPVEARRKQCQSAWRLRRHRRLWHEPDLEAYRQLLSQDPRSRIVATYHFGDFAFGLNTLLREDPKDRECIVLTQQTSDGAYFSNMRRAFGDEATTAQQQWPVANLRTANLSAKLQKQVVTLVTFCDLPPTFGATTEVQFLDRSARFPRGAAALALRYKLPLLPVVCYHSAGRHRIALWSQIEPIPVYGEKRAECVSRLTQQLADHLQQFVRWAPQQWRFLGSLPSYIAATEVKQADHPETGAHHESG